MKYAYPNFGEPEVLSKPLYNLNKWLDAMRQIYSQMHFGEGRHTATKNIVGNWDKTEQRDFGKWMNYYEGNNHQKYKIANANFYVNDNIPGYFVPNPAPKSAPSPVPDISEPASIVNQTIQTQLDKEQKRKIVEEQRKRIISRLNAAVRHLTAREGHMLAGNEFDRLLSSLYDLIKQFQTINKISLSNQLFYDLIVRQANKLDNSGFGKSSKFLKKFADVTGDIDLKQSPLPITSKPDMGGTLENPAAPSADLLTVSPPGEHNEEKDPLDELLENLETSGLTDLNSSSDEEIDEITLDELIAEAQMMPAPAAIKPHVLPSEEDLEVSLPENVQRAQSKDIDSKIDIALSNVTIQDVIKKIEGVTAIFQNRAIARELSVIDLMLSTLGLSSYFSNTLSEIIQKSHEGHNYSMSRLSDMLTKLRGAVVKDNVDLIEDPVAQAPEIKQIQQRLENQKNKEEKAKEMRKQIQQNELVKEMQDTENKGKPAEISPAQEILTQAPQILQ